MAAEMVQEEVLLRVELQRDMLQQMDDPISFALSEALQIAQRGDRPPEINLLATSARKLSILVVAET